MPYIFASFTFLLIIFVFEIKFYYIFSNHILMVKKLSRRKFTTGSYLSEKVSKEVGEAMRIQYGGSVSAKNCKELANCPDIDGI